MSGLALSPELEAFRAEVCTFLETELSEEMRAEQRATKGIYPEPELSLAWQHILHRKGWAAPVWPKEYGGPGWDGAKRFIFETECALAGAPVLYPIGLRLVGPVIIEFGSDEQRNEWLPRILDGRDYWCQGFSEPGAGSDLASLKTRAQIAGDRYVVNGSKIWTTHAHHANRIFTLVRTAVTERRQEGITVLAIDVDAPGVTINPIISIDGEHEVNEIFLSDVEVPASNRIGEEGQGWEIAKYLLEFERGTGMFAGRLRAALNRIAEAARHSDRLEDPEFANDLSEIVAEVDCYEMLEYLTLAPVEPGRSPGPVASVLKLRASRLKQSISQLGLNVLGPDALRYENANGENGVMIGEALATRAATIFGGAEEIQLSIIAKTLARI